MSYSMKIAKGIRDTLTADDVSFDFNEARGVFKFNMAISGKIKHLSYVIKVRESSFTVYAISSISADSDDSEVMAEMAEFLTRANYGLVNGNFEMDYRDGEIRYKVCVYCGNGSIPDDSIIELCLLVSGRAFEVYSAGIIGVAFSGMSGKQAYELCGE